MIPFRLVLRRLAGSSLQQTAAPESISVTFANLYGDRVTVPCDVGTTLLDAAKKHNIPIDGACGGGGDAVDSYGEGAQCTFCHVDIANEFLDRIPKADWRESDLLEEVLDRKQNTRLACQIRLTPELNGMSVAVPEYQDSDIP